VSRPIRPPICSPPWNLSRVSFVTKYGDTTHASNEIWTWRDKVSKTCSRNMAKATEPVKESVTPSQCDVIPTVAFPVKEQWQCSVAGKEPLLFDLYLFPIPLKVGGWVGLGDWLVMYTKTGRSVTHRLLSGLDVVTLLTFAKPLPYHVKPPPNRKYANVF